MSDRTERDLKIVALHAEGTHTYQEIADALGVTLYVVKNAIKFAQKVGRGGGQGQAPAESVVIEGELEYHPLANLFPLIEGEEFEALVADVKVNGLRESIMLFEGKILDGRNRFRACRASEVPARYEVFTAGDALAFVISKNLKRRHLNETQRAMVAARLANMGHGGDRRSDQPANLPVEKTVSQGEAAVLLNVSERSVRSARSVLDHATPDLMRAVDSGKLAVSAGAKAASFGEETQHEIAAHVESGRLNSVQTIIKKSTRQVRENLLGKVQQALPDKRYGVIAADPAWKHVTRSENGMLKVAANHYPTMMTDEIAAMPVPTIVADDCVLFLWAIVPMLPDALKVMAAWGFEYRSHLVWEKIYPGERQGLGYWSRINHELLLIGTRGNVPAPAPGTQPGSIIKAPFTGRHSEKPEVFLQLIEVYFPTLPKIELNRRGPARPGWDAWGNEVEEIAASDPGASSGVPEEGPAVEPRGDEGSATSSAKGNDFDAPAFLKRDQAA